MNEGSDKPPLTPGTLYLVATPIGNLEDITLRAIRTLGECDLIAAEDTRRTGILLKHLGISKPMVSLHKFNEKGRSNRILETLNQGQTVAVVSDAGSPGISDPGEKIVVAAIEAGYRIEAVPGPCAMVAAVTASGLPTDAFQFIGFLPHKSGQRRKALEGALASGMTTILYESPYRIRKLLASLAELTPESQVVLGRELTKKFEEYLRGTPEELLKHYAEREPKGEFVVVLPPSPKER